MESLELTCRRRPSGGLGGVFQGVQAVVGSGPFLVDAQCLRDGFLGRCLEEADMADTCPAAAA